MKKEIQRLLYQGGVFRTYVGYTYFEEAVLLVYEKSDRLLNICKEVYLPIAQKYNVNASVVEKDIRTVRDAFMRNNGNAILKELGYHTWTTRYPYPRELIEIFAAHLRT